MKSLPEQIKSLNAFTPQYSCRFHPTNSFHEVGCPHQEWTKQELQAALNQVKQSNAYLIYLLAQWENKNL